MTPIKPYLIRAIELIEAIEDTQRQEKENRETASKTDVPEYAKICTEIADKTVELVNNLEKQLELTRQQILLIWHE
jgi:hypothetical protein